MRRSEHNGRFAALIALCATVWAMPFALAQDSSQNAPAETAPIVDFVTEVGDAPPLPAELLPPPQAQNGTNVFIAGHRTVARRHSDYFTTAGKPRKRPLATSARLRRQDDSNFTNRTRFLSRRVTEMGRPVGTPDLRVAETGQEFLAALVAASRERPIANLVVYGHAAPNALFMREDRGFYGSVIEVAKVSHVVSGGEIEKDEQLRLAGARDLSDFEQLVARGDIRFTHNAVIVFAGCGVAGKRDVEPGSIAARMAEITRAKVIASVDVTDQSMARGKDFRNKEYSRKTWVRFPGGQSSEKMNTKVIDALQQLNFDGAAVAAAEKQRTN